MVKVQSIRQKSYWHVCLGGDLSHACLDSLLLLVGPKSRRNIIGWEGTLYPVPALSPDQPRVDSRRLTSPISRPLSQNEESWIQSEVTSQFSQETCFVWPWLSHFFELIANIKKLESFTSSLDFQLLLNNWKRCSCPAGPLGNCGLALRAGALFRRGSGPQASPSPTGPVAVSLPFGPCVDWKSGDLHSLLQKLRLLLDSAS